LFATFLAGGTPLVCALGVAEMARASCPACGATLKIADAARGTKGKCPSCGEKVVIPGRDESLVTEPRPRAAGLALAESDGAKPMNKVGRFLSAHWLVLIFVFGFLPWSEVSCSSNQVNLRVTQSGYEAVYGDVSSPFGSVEAMREAARNDASPTKQSLAAQSLAVQIEKVRSDYLLACSPFMLLFWMAAVAMLGFVILIPLGHLRLGWCSAFAGIMLLMLVMDIAFGSPLERRVTMAGHDAIKADREGAMLLVAGLASGKTTWFWLTLSAVFLIAVTELLSNLLWRNPFESVRFAVPAVWLGSAGAVACAGLAVQAVLWQFGITAMESELAKLHRAEQEQLAKAKAAEEDRQQREQAAARERQRQIELGRERARLAEEQRKADDERRARERADERARLEIERQKAEEERKLKELEKKREDERIAREQEAVRRQEEAKPQSLLDEAEKLYKDGKAEEALELMDKAQVSYPKTDAGKRAGRRLTEIKAKIKRSEDVAYNRWLYARTLYQDGSFEEAHKRLKAVQKDYAGTKAAQRAKELQGKIEEEHPELKQK
jgi:hypothetical protein